MGDDLPLTEGIAQEGASKKMLGLAIIAVAITTGAGATLILRYVATCFAICIGVVNLFGRWFFGFVDGIICTHFSCHWSRSPVEDLGTPKVRSDVAMREGQLYSTGRISRNVSENTVSDSVTISLAGMQKPLVPSNVFGGITDCEGGGGWVSRTPFLAGNCGL